MGLELTTRLIIDFMLSGATVGLLAVCAVVRVRLSRRTADQRGKIKKLNLWCPCLAAF